MGFQDQELPFLRARMRKKNETRAAIFFLETTKVESLPLAPCLLLLWPIQTPTHALLTLSGHVQCPQDSRFCVMASWMKRKIKCEKANAKCQVGKKKKESVGPTLKRRSKLRLRKCTMATEHQTKPEILAQSYYYSVFHVV